MKKMLSLFGNALLIVIITGVVNDAIADCGENTEVTRLSTTLSPAEGVDTQGKGRVHWTSKEKGEKTRDRLQAKVVIPVPSTVPLVGTEQDAQQLQIRLVLSHEGAAYAQCFLNSLKVDEETEESREARYHLHVEQKVHHGTIKSVIHRGSCDIDLAQDGIQDGIPRPVAGDMLDVDAGGAVFLHGQF